MFNMFNRFRRHTAMGGAGVAAPVQIPAPAAVDYRALQEVCKDSLFNWLRNGLILQPYRKDENEYTSIFHYYFQSEHTRPIFHRLLRYAFEIHGNNSEIYTVLERTERLMASLRQDPAIADVFLVYPDLRRLEIPVAQPVFSPIAPRPPLHPRPADVPVAPRYFIDNDHRAFQEAVGRSQQVRAEVARAPAMGGAGAGAVMRPTRGFVVGSFSQTHSLQDFERREREREAEAIRNASWRR